ncbi:transcriptional regulator family: Fungal Specific TF [Paecilomyces variotii]|nr:transcriptional regulator family: Fungal Specific TF [Paecilomyces variotii]KAJ9251171.1 transcriptional regulator family: Fungal Specific TF [Paecilomyces variotii]KAJ9256656.1 transcriptional regulator family: Fungal Specific TF [Paecilomyces variotii]KAJ9370647.1 transcriptional regulator family: Fungal Specific TF [Paecilomyces variotii]
MVLKRKIDSAGDVFFGYGLRPKRHASNATSTNDRNPRFDMLEEDSPLSSRKGSGHLKPLLAQWTEERERPWRSIGTKDVAYSMPLENMVEAVQHLIDPDFDPSVLTKDDEPRFLKPLPSRICREDIEFLRERGALMIPDEELRIELLRSYVRWVYNFMPTIDLHEFLRCVVENDPDGNISLLVFQAVMFAGTAFVDIKYLQEAGFETRQSARKEFFARVRHLYAFDYEDDRIAVLQTLLLMTYWADYESSPQKDIWHWIGVCNTQALSIGLHKDPTQSDMDPQLQRLRIRLWWSLYSRDRLIAMALRRPTQINEGTCDVPMITLNDCDIEPFHPSVIEVLGCPQLENVSHQKRLAVMFIENVKLCQCLGRILFAQYTPSNHQFGATTKTTITLVPRQASEAELNRCSQQLDRWLHGLPRDAQFIPPSKNHIREGENVLLLHSAMLRMIYHMTSSTLHRPQALIFSAKDRSRNVKGPNVARTKLEDAATSITQIVQGLSQLNLVRFLPQSVVTVLLPAALAHLVNLTSPNPSVRQTSAYNFSRCIEALHRLKEIYPAADMEVTRIETAVKVQRMRLEASIRISCNNDNNNAGLDRQTASTILSELLACSGDSPSPESDSGVKEIPDQPTPTMRARTISNNDPGSPCDGISPRTQPSTIQADYPAAHRTTIHPTTIAPGSLTSTTMPPQDRNPVEPFQPFLHDFTTSPTDMPRDINWTEDVLKAWTNVDDDDTHEDDFTQETDIGYESTNTDITATTTTYDATARKISQGNEITGDLDRDLGFV